MNNEKIATKIMGWEKHKRWPWIWMIHNGPTSHNVSQPELPDFINDMNATMMVIDKMADNGYCLDMGFNREWSEATFYKGYDGDGQKIDSSHAHADTLITAICTAALNAIIGGDA